MTISKNIADWVAEHPKSEAFFTSDLLHLGSRSAIDQTLCRLVKANTVVRLARGKFVVQNDITSGIGFDPIECVLRGLGRHHNCQIQVPVRDLIKHFQIEIDGLRPDPAYMWSLKEKRLRVRGTEVNLRCVSPRKVALCGRGAGMAATAIWQIGKRKMTELTMNKILNRLSNAERAALEEAPGALPAWAANQVVKSNKLAKANSPSLGVASTLNVARTKSLKVQKGTQESGDIAVSPSKPTLKKVWPSASAEGRWSGFGPYYAMFPVEFAHRIVSTYCPEGGGVIDPFCGRGTVPFVALATGRSAVGCDINPVAWVYAKTKTDPYVDPDVILRRVRQIDRSITRSDRTPRNEFQELAWSKDVLGFLHAARRSLNWRQSRIDRTLMAMLLVHLHAKPGNGFSNQMRQSKAMAPEYSVQWWRENNKLPPEIDIVASLEKRLSWRYKFGVVESKDDIEKPTILLGDAPTMLKRVPREFSASLLLSSPPYFGVTNYRYDNWIRLWLLGDGPPLPNTDTWARHGNKEQYRSLLLNTFKASKRRCNEDAAVYIRTDARKFTLTTTVDVLREVWPDRSMYFAFDGFKKATQTALFGDKEQKPGEVDLFIAPRSGIRPMEMKLLKSGSYPETPNLK